MRALHRAASLPGRFRQPLVRHHFVAADTASGRADGFHWFGLSIFHVTSFLSGGALGFLPASRFPCERGPHARGGQQPALRAVWG